MFEVLATHTFSPSLVGGFSTILADVNRDGRLELVMGAGTYAGAKTCCFSGDLRKMWEYPIDGVHGNHYNDVFLGDRLIVGGWFTVYALDGSGKEIWHKRVSGGSSGWHKLKSNIVGMAKLSEDRVVIADRFEKVLALNRYGDLAWECPLPEGVHQLYTNPVVYGGNVYLAGVNRDSERGRLLCIQGSSGRLLWKIELDRKADYPASMPVLGDWGSLWVTGWGNAILVDPRGAIIASNYDIHGGATGGAGCIVGDFNNNGQPDLALPLPYSQLWDISLSKRYWKVRTLATKDWIAAVDIDQDGIEEIIYGQTCYAPPVQIRAMSGSTGVHKYRVDLEKTERTELIGTPVLGDLNGDGMLELVAITQKAIYLLATQGRASDAWPYAQRSPEHNGSLIPPTVIDSFRDLVKFLRPGILIPK